MVSPQASNRRQYPRLKAAVDCKFIDLPLVEEYLPVIDISLGGMRLHTNHAVKINDKMRVELSLLDNTSIICTARVAWLKPLPLWAPLKHDVGFQFLDLSNDNIRHLASILQVSPTIVNAAIDSYFMSEPFRLFGFTKIIVKITRLFQIFQGELFLLLKENCTR